MPGPHTSEGLQDLWQMAANLDLHALTEEQRARGERHIPIDAIEVRFAILPRSEQTADRETVERYMEVFDQLPAITLQAGTLVLIDGLHRLEAAFSMEGRYHIRAVLREVTDADLWIEAFRANAAHGRPLTVRERQTFADRLLREHADWTDRYLADLSGMDRHTIARRRERIAPRAPAPPESLQTQSSGTMRHSVAESTTSVEQGALDWDAPEPSPPPSPPAPAPAARPTAPQTPADVKQLAFDFGKARSLFDDYNPSFIVERYRADGVPKLVRELETWRAWIDEALDAAKARLGGGA